MSRLTALGLLVIFNYHDAAPTALRMVFKPGPVSLQFLMFAEQELGVPAAYDSANFRKNCVTSEFGRLYSALTFE